MRVISIDVTYMNETYIDFPSYSDREKYKIALSDDNIAIWDDIKSFESDLNNDLVDTENCFIYFINE